MKPKSLSAAAHSDWLLILFNQSSPVLEPRSQWCMQPTRAEVGKFLHLWPLVVSSRAETVIFIDKASVKVFVTFRQWLFIPYLTHIFCLLMYLSISCWVLLVEKFRFIISSWFGCMLKKLELPVKKKKKKQSKESGAACSVHDIEDIFVAPQGGLNCRMKDDWVMCLLGVCSHCSFEWLFFRFIL